MILSGLLVILFGMGYCFEIHVFWYYLVLQMLSGLFQATGWPWVVAVVENWYQEQGYWWLIMGIWNPFVSMGNIVGTLLAGFALHRGWGLSFIIPGLMMVAGGLLVLFFLIPHPESIQFPNQDEETGHIRPGRHRHQSGQDEAATTQERQGNDPGQGDVNNMNAIGRVYAAFQIPGVKPYAGCLLGAKFLAYMFVAALPSQLSKNSKVFTYSYSFLFLLLFLFVFCS